MFTLLSGLWKYIFQKDEYFILILGLDNAGKTVSVYSILHNISSYSITSKTSILDEFKLYLVFHVICTDKISLGINLNAYLARHCEVFSVHSRYTKLNRCPVTKPMNGEINELYSILK